MTHDPTIEQQRPGRVLAVIVRDSTKGNGFVFARDTETNEEYFIHKTVVPPDLWTTLERGTAISCGVSETSKGLRGRDVRAVTEQEQAIVDTTGGAENYGNR